MSEDGVTAWGQTQVLLHSLWPGAEPAAPGVRSAGLCPGVQNALPHSRLLGFRVTGSPGLAISQFFFHEFF